MNIKHLYKRLKSEDKAGLYITVIFHLTVIIVLLAIQIGAVVSKENSFVLDFSKQEETERLAKEEEFRENVSRRIDEMLRTASAVSDANIRNIAVDASSPKMKDDRGTDAEQLYKDAERLAKELADGPRQALYEDARDETVEISGQKSDKSSQKEYKGPSVVSYTLDGRKASHLKIPAYRCMGGGDVTVLITVDPQGNVINAKIYDSLSASDQCLRDFAIRAARLSKFSKSATAPSRQQGEIVYRFIAQ
ncbi:MAG: hypothetical protein OSJ55_01780 [Bacteroidales bacterium]|nr:hypothetical protein [Bacteroidales bacterium]